VEEVHNELKKASLALIEFGKNNNRMKREGFLLNTIKRHVG